MQWSNDPLSVITEICIFGQAGVKPEDGSWERTVTHNVLRRTDIGSKSKIFSHVKNLQRTDRDFQIQ